MGSLHESKGKYRTPFGYITDEKKATYRVWRGMLRRCFDPRRPEWKFYGGRGITVCERWLNFPNFLEDMGLRPDGLTIERINNDGPYAPDNCKWIPASDQFLNQRPPSSRTFGRPPRSPAKRLEDLSERQRQIGMLLWRGHNARQIAQELSLSHQTVRDYMKNLYHRLGLKSRALVVLWVDRNMRGSTTKD